MRLFRDGFVTLLAVLLCLVPPARADGSSAGFDLAGLQQAAQSGDGNAKFELGTLEYVGLGVI